MRNTKKSLKKDAKSKINEGRPYVWGVFFISQMDFCGCLRYVNDDQEDAICNMGVASHDQS